MALSKLSGTDRFKQITDSEIAKIHSDVQKKNTKKNDKAAERQFCEYLATQGMDCNFWDMSPETLEGHLSKFWFAARQTKIDPKTNQPKKYMVQTLRTIRYALQRVLREKGKECDIIVDKDFRKSQTAFTDACKQLKEEGYGYIKPTDEIDPEGKIHSETIHFFTD